MKILFLTPQLPYPPRQGTTLRNYHLIRHLARDHTIHLVTFIAPGERLDSESPLHQLCERIETLPQPQRPLWRRGVETITSPWPDMGLRLTTSRAHRLIQGLIATQSYAIVQVEGIEMAAYGWRALHAVPRAMRPAFVFDDHNAEYLLQKRAALVDLQIPRRWPAALYSLIQWQKLSRYERTICRAADAVLAVSDPDREALRRLHPKIEPVVVPNGIDLSGYAATPFTSADDCPTLVFTGKMDYRPNVDAVLWFAQAVLPLVEAQVPEVRFQIVGMNPHSRLDALRDKPAITITGAVEDPRPYVQNAAVYVVPMRVGGGTRFKVLEAMASQKPIVSTSLGVEGIAVGDGEELLIADTPDHFAARIVELLHDQNGSGVQSRALGKAAYEFVEANYTWDRIIPRLQTLYRQIGPQG
ncbi:MAG: glycosyltransferase [Caldilineaceae bacterium]|nr:glycosyltransferase [Caldilineaceae bacterium]